MDTVTKKARYFDEINILRAIAILAVISIHVSADFARMSTINLLTTTYMAIDVFSHFAVPLFIAISGFVLYNKYSDSIDLKKFYKKRLKSTLPPYFVFSTFYLSMTYIGSIVLTKSVNLDIPHIIYRYTTGECFYHLWFFVLIIQLYLLYPIILWMYHSFESRGRVFELLLATFLIGVIYRLCPIPDVDILGVDTPIVGVATMFIGHLFYFILGMAVRSRYDELRLKSVSKTSLYCISIPLLFCTLLGIFGCAQGYFNLDVPATLLGAEQYWHWLTVAITPLYYVIIFALCLSFSLHLLSSKPIGFKLLDKIGHYSFGIYLVHAFILYMLTLVFPMLGFDYNNWFYYPVIFCLTLILSYISVEIIQKIPYSKYIIGSTR